MTTPIRPFDNVISDNDFYSGVIEAARQSAEILHRHCGPFAANAVRSIGIGKGNEIDEFTKDGISIMRMCRASTPQSDFVKRLLTFIGERVDSICHDGTTTSMMFFAKCIEHVTTFTAQCVDEHRLQAAALCKKLLHRLDECIDENTISFKELHARIKKVKPSQSLQNTKRALAYHQALVSSKGDTELASAISEVIASIPVEMFGSYVINNDVFESDKRFRVDTQDFDIGFRSNLGNLEFNNTEQGTELLFKDADLIFTSVKLVKGCPAASFLKALLLTTKVRDALMRSNKDKFITPDEDRFYYQMESDVNYITRPLVIIAPEIADPILIDMINIFRRLYPDTPVVYTTIQNSVRLRQFYESAVSATAGVMPLSETMNIDPLASIIPHVKIEIKHNYCMISNLYKKDKHAFHPFYRNKKRFPFYTKTLEDITTKITQYDKGHVETMSQSDIQELIMLYRMMTCQKIRDLKVGGTSHELAANMSVANDAYGAAMSALTDGVVLGGYPKLLASLKAALVKCDDESPVEEHEYYTLSNTVTETLIDAVEGVISSIYRTAAPPTRWVDNERTPLCLSNKWTFLVPVRSLLTGAYVHATFPKEVKEKEWVYDFLNPDRATEVVLFQPVVGYKEQIRRLKDVLPKLINSSVLIDQESGL